MAQYAALFSGQGSQYPGMGKELFDNFSEVKKIYECAGDLFGFDVAGVSFGGTEEALADTRVAQPVIFTHSAACFAAARESMPAPVAVAGHSLGEFAALYAAGAYSLEDGMGIIKARANAMADVTTAGTMYAVVGGDAAEVEAACRQAGGFVLPVNFNLPGQTVISGEPEPCARAAAILGEAGRRVVQLSVSSAFHTSMMEPAAETLTAALAGMTFAPTAVDFYSNLTGGKLVIDDYPAYFARHMVSPVRFVEEMNTLAEGSVGVCIEFGPKKTACTLAKKNVKRFSVGNVEDLGSLAKAAELVR